MVTRKRVLAASVAAAFVAAAAAGCASSSAGTKSTGNDSPGLVMINTSKYDGNLVPATAKPTGTLTDDLGKPFNIRTMTKGTVTLLFFGYTHCPDVCPTTMADLATALRKLPVGLRDRVQVVFVTTDPKRDTPGVIRAWLANFDPDLTTKFVGLTGPQAGIDDAERAAGVPLAQDGGMTHSAEVLLYGRDNECRVFYVQGSSPDDMAHDVRLVA
jgi:protein SCO1